MSPTPEEIRAEVVNALAGPGGERLSLTARLAEVDATLKPLVRRAVDAGIVHPRIMELTGLARGTIRAWTRTPAD